MNFKFLPNLITLLNLFLGCIVTLLLIENNLEVKNVFIISVICLILDYLDGYTARKLNAKSDVGIQLDSLADLVKIKQLAKKLDAEIITTEKDFSKISKLNFENINVLKIDLKINNENILINFLKAKINE